MSVKRELFLVFLLLLFCQTLFSQNQAETIDSLIHLITPETYRHHFDSIHAHPSCFRKVTEGTSQSADHDGCRDYIFRTLQKYLGNDQVKLQSFNEKEYMGLANVIGIKRGIDPTGKILIISAHYDSNNNRNETEENCSPGANDNGTGLAAILEIARVLSTVEIKNTVIFAAWDFEEEYTYGFPTGSNRWFDDCTCKLKKINRPVNRKNNKIARENIIANINFDMFGNPGDSIDNKPVLWVCSGIKAHSGFADEYITTFNQFVSSVKAINKGVLIYSDHYTFAARRIPAVENLESEYDNDPIYHTCKDNIDNSLNINYQFATDVTRGGFSFLLTKAGI